MAGKLSIVLLFLASIARAGAPASVTVELSRWRAAVKTERAVTLAALVPVGETIEITSGNREPLTLDRDALRAHLDAGESDTLGLSTHLLLPAARDLRRVGARYEARHRRCPEVVWVFERRSNGRARLVAIRRVFLEC